MTFERFVALTAVILISAGWGLVAMWNVWGLWPLSWCWWAANVVVTLVLGVVFSHLIKP